LSLLQNKEEREKAIDGYVDEYGEKNTTLDRINPHGDYTKDNCRWATWTQQQTNKR